METLIETFIKQNSKTKTLLDNVELVISKHSEEPLYELHDNKYALKCIINETLLSQAALRQLKVPNSYHLIKIKSGYLDILFHRDTLGNIVPYLTSFIDRFTIIEEIKFPAKVVPNINSNEFVQKKLKEYLKIHSLNSQQKETNTLDSSLDASNFINKKFNTAVSSITSSNKKEKKLETKDNCFYFNKDKQITHSVVEWITTISNENEGGVVNKEFVDLFKMQPSQLNNTDNVFNVEKVSLDKEKKEDLQMLKKKRNFTIDKSFKKVPEPLKTLFKENVEILADFNIEDLERYELHRKYLNRNKN